MGKGTVQAGRHSMSNKLQENLQEKKINGTFRILSAAGILLVVAGHADFHLFDLGGLFPYYSFHVAVFLFISGYFYTEEAEQGIGAYVKKKAQRLLLPYFVWNLFYGLFTAVLHGTGFTIGQKIGFRTLFLDPFLNGHQFGWNFPAWFVPALFLIEVLNVFMRKVLGWLHMKKEWLILFLCLLAGMLTVWFAIGGHVWGNYKFPGRILFMMPCYQMGCFYKNCLEKYDTLPDGIYFTGLLVLQLILVSCCGGLAYSTVWCTGFANGPAVPYLTTVTGIAFWLRIARRLEPALGNLPGTERIGGNTYAVMMHHIFGFFMVKGALCGIGAVTPWFHDFDRAAFLNDIGYIYVPGGVEAFKWVYIVAGIGVPLMIREAAGGISRWLSGRRCSMALGAKRADAELE